MGRCKLDEYSDREVEAWPETYQLPLALTAGASDYAGQLRWRPMRPERRCSGRWF